MMSYKRKPVARQKPEPAAPRQHAGGSFAKVSVPEITRHELAPSDNMECEPCRTLANHLVTMQWALIDVDKKRYHYLYECPMCGAKRSVIENFSERSAFRSVYTKPQKQNVYMANYLVTAPEQCETDADGDAERRYKRWNSIPY